jgi:hypothetical protein
MPIDICHIHRFGLTVFELDRRQKATGLIILFNRGDSRNIRLPIVFFRYLCGRDPISDFLECPRRAQDSGLRSSIAKIRPSTLTMIFGQEII